MLRFAGAVKFAPGYAHTKYIYSNQYTFVVDFGWVWSWIVHVVTMMVAKEV